MATPRRRINVEREPLRASGVEAREPVHEPVHAESRRTRR